jgi:hypothetical protein
MASRPLLVRTLDRPLILLGSEPPNRFDPPHRGERAGVPAVTIFQAWLRATKGSVYDRAIRSSRPIPVTLVRWSSGPEVMSPGRLTWLFQFTSVPCGEPGFAPPGGSPPPLDRDGCDEYAMFDAQSGATVGGFSNTAGAVVLRAP